MKIVLPASLEPRREEIEQLVAERIEQFTVCCNKWQKPAKCEQVLVKTQTIQVVDHFRFPLAGTARGSANGQFLKNGRLLKVCLYNIMPGFDSGIHTRTREQMAELAVGKRGKAYWSNHSAEIFSANPNDLLPGLVHELCHHFGALVGHVAGKEDCQPVK
jgi:hypothetical protein